MTQQNHPSRFSFARFFSAKNTSCDTDNSGILPNDEKVQPTKVDWHGPGQSMHSTCPVCGSEGEKRMILRVTIPAADFRTDEFVECPSCKSGYVHNYETPEYEQYHITERNLAFYVEQGAAVDFLARPPTLAAKHGVKNYLEIGCGFGFGVDFAEKALGLNARGIDPAPQAKRGASDLGISITPEYLTETSAERHGKQDMIVAMEVIEHIPEPQGFLQIIRENLSPNGIVMMSTPNIRALDDPNCPVLMAVLSPTYHAILFSAEALAEEFRKAGFGYVNVDETADSLMVVASLDGTPVDAAVSADPRIFADYTGNRMRAFADNPTLWSGFAYRHLKALVNQGWYDEAWAVLPEIEDGYVRHFGIEIQNTDRVFSQWVERFPSSGENKKPWNDETARFSLGNLLYFIGVLHLNTKGPHQALGFFQTAARINRSWVAAYEAAGYGDGETASLEKEALKLLSYCAGELAKG